MDADQQLTSELANASPVIVGKWTFHPNTMLLQYGEQTIKLEPRVALLLHFLIEKAGEPISRDALMDRVWGDVMVGDEALTSAIAKLRKALGEDSQHSETIKTIPKIGYQLVAEVAGVASRNSTAYSMAPNKKRTPAWIVVVASSFLIVTALMIFGHFTQTEKSSSELPAATPSIAVLPFSNKSNDEEQEYFVDGLTEDLITDISKISGLRVIARHSTYAYKDLSPDIRDVGQRLGASHVIEGSVQKSGNTIRINIQLVDASNGTHMWAERYDREIKEVFAIQDEVIGEIIDALSLELTPNESKLVARHDTDNLAAYDLFMRGRQQEGIFTEDSFDKAQRFYEQAVVLDPEYAEAWARLAQIHALNGQFGWVENIESADQLAFDLINKAVGLNPDSAYIRYGYSRILARDSIGRHDDAITEVETAIELDPNFADAYGWLGQLYILTGKASKAIEPIKVAMRINPNFPFWYEYTYGFAHYFLGDYETAANSIELAVEKNPNVYFSRLAYAASLAMAGRQDDAEWQLEELTAIGFNKTREELIEEHPIQDSTHLRLYDEGLKKAGLN